MGIGLADHHVAIDGVGFAALVAGDDACRDAGGAHQEDEGRGVVFAEAAARLEEKLIDGVLAKQRRLQRIYEGFPLEELQRLGCDCGRVGAVSGLPLHG